MKKYILCAMTVPVLCALLCGCGSDRMGNDNTVLETPIVSPYVEPSTSPMVSPDIEDGVVEDRDGIIEEEEDHSTSGGNSSSANTGKTSRNSTTMAP